MAERTISGFKLTSAVVICPECSAPFHKELLTDTPLLTVDDIVEADMHRVFPDPALRAALIGLCPECKYCGWATSFVGGNKNGSTAKKEPSLPYTKKYAIAVKCARARNTHPLDIAFIAINGLWCAREAAEDDQLWLELVAYEHSRGMEDEFPSRSEEDGMAHLMMGEIWRQLKQYDRAKREYELALRDVGIMPEIIRHQIGLCERKVSGITALPLHIVRQLFPFAENQTEDELEEFIPSLEATQKVIGLAEVKESQAKVEVEAPQKITAETAMLSAISSLLSAQAALLSEESNEADHAAISSAAVTPTKPEPVPTIRPARPRTKGEQSPDDSRSAPTPAGSAALAPVQHNTYPQASQPTPNQIAHKHQPVPTPSAQIPAQSPVQAPMPAPEPYSVPVPSQIAAPVPSAPQATSHRQAPSAGHSPIQPSPRVNSPAPQGSPSPTTGNGRASVKTSSSSPTQPSAPTLPKPVAPLVEARTSAPSIQSDTGANTSGQSNTLPQPVAPMRRMPGSTSNSGTGTAQPVSLVAPQSVVVAPVVPAQPSQPSPVSPTQSVPAVVQPAPGVAQTAVTQQTYVQPVIQSAVQTIVQSATIADPAPTAVTQPQPLLLNVQGIARVQNGNSLPRTRHSHKFRHSTRGPQRPTGEGWMSDYGLVERPPTPVYGEESIDPTTHYERSAETHGDPLPDFDIEDPNGKSTRTKRAQQSATTSPPPGQQQKDTPAQQAGQDQSSDHSDAIARVESYLSFSRALHTRSFLKYN